jgi:hypothetical protein
MKLTRVLREAFLVILIFLVTGSLAVAQKYNQRYVLEMRESVTPIVIDGVEEDTWKSADVATDFYMVLPMDTSYARVRTDVKMTYDKKNLYLIAICYHAVEGRYFVESLRRDFVFGKNDNFLVFIDPFEDQTNGFSFGANAAGAQWDGTMFGGGAVDLNWDNKWISKVTYDEEKWVFEMAIPFTTIRYKKGITEWGINFSRLDLKTTEKSSWAPVPRQFPTASLAYTGILRWDKAPPDPGLNISVIPYVAGSLIRDHQNNVPEEYDGKAGVDVKIAVTSALNLDLTVNPDFSQVEVDRQVTNLERFELFFPERRQFFLENADLFANFGYGTLRPFFSRRIGLGVPIRAGARLSGKLTKDWRIGLMDMQTAAVNSTALPDQNFAILSLQRKMFARSNITFLLVNKESINYTVPDDPAVPAYSRYNRNVGIEYNLASSNNKWTGKAFVLKSFSPGLEGKDFVQAANLQYNSRHWSIGLQEEQVGSNYTAEVGFVPRRGYVKFAPSVGYLFFPKGTRVLSHGPRFMSNQFFDENMSSTDYLNLFFYTVNFRSQSVFTLVLIDEYVRLLSPFDPTVLGKETLPAGTRHHWTAFRTDFVSKPQSLVRYAFNSRYGSYYSSGKWIVLGGEIGYRFQPYVSLLVNASYNDIRLPLPWDRNYFWLVGPQVDITMTNTIFFSTFLQYNEQTNNMNINSRFQWRYRPASDLFIVYTENYLPETFGVKNRALVVKFTYWWNR